MKKLLVFLAAFLISTSAFAADIVTKAPPSFNYPTGNGWYAGVGTLGGGGSASVSAPGVNTNSLTTTTISVYGIVGYTWQIPNSPMFAAIEQMIGVQNFNGSTPGLSLSGNPVDFKSRFLIGAPINQIAQFFPSLGITMPTFSSMPAGFTAQSERYYFGLGVNVSDDSLNFGTQTGKVWGTSFSYYPVGMLVQLTNGSVADFYTELRFAQYGLCVGAPTGDACSRQNLGAFAGLSYKFGL